MKAVFPVCWHVVDIHENLLQVENRIVRLCLIRECAVGNAENADHHRYPEDCRAAFCDLESKEQLGIEERG